LFRARREKKGKETKKKMTVMTVSQRYSYDITHTPFYATPPAAATSHHHDGCRWLAACLPEEATKRRRNVLFAITGRNNNWSE